MKTLTVAPKERVNITYQSTTHTDEQIELPLKLLLLGEFVPQHSKIALDERSVLSLDKNNIDQVMAKQQISLSLDLPKYTVTLSFNSMRDFEPDHILSQVPELQQLMALRHALVTLKGPLGNIPAFSKALKTILHHPETRKRLVEQLRSIEGVGTEYVTGC